MDDRDQYLNGRTNDEALRKRKRQVHWSQGSLCSGFIPDELAAKKLEDEQNKKPAIWKVTTDIEADAGVMHCYVRVTTTKKSTRSRYFTVATPFFHEATLACHNEMLDMITEWGLEGL